MMLMRESHITCLTKVVDLHSDTQMTELPVDIGFRGISATDVNRTQGADHMTEGIILDEHAKFKYVINGKLMKNNESKQCSHSADVGFICPLKYEDPFQKVYVQDLSVCDDTVRNELASDLLHEWGSINEVKSVEESSKFIEEQWCASDVMYVLISDNTFAGCVAVDRKNFLPCISHVYVVRDKRNKGFSKLLMQVAEEYIKSMGFDEARLWCEEKLANFYAKMGYLEEKKQEHQGVLQCIMVKKFSN